MVYNYIREKEDSEIIKVFNNIRAPGWIKFTKRTYNDVVSRVSYLQKGIGASMNYNKDFTDNHRYNKLRTKLIAQRKRQEDRENSERI